MTIVDYRIYPSLLDSYANYLASGELYQKYWGFAENPSKTEEEWEQEQFQSLMDSINRMPFRSVYADMGTAFNEVVDVMLSGEPSDKVKMERVYKVPTTNNVVVGIKAHLNGRTYTFPIEMVRHFYDLYRGAVPQLYVEGLLQTRLGVVQLYGYLDELMPISVHDIKTTNRHEPWKFKGNTQHHAYPYCLREMGVKIDSFVYDIAELTSNAKKEQEALEKGVESGDVLVTEWEYHREEYAYNHRDSEMILAERCESLIEFLEEHREQITNTKLFGGR